MPFVYFLIAIALILEKCWPVIVIGIALYFIIAIWKAVKSSNLKSKNNQSDAKYKDILEKPMNEFLNVWNDDYNITIEPKEISSIEESVLTNTDEILSINTDIPHIPVENKETSSQPNNYNDNNSDYITNDSNFNTEYLDDLTCVSKENATQLTQLIYNLTACLPKFINGILLNAVHRESRNNVIKTLSKHICTFHKSELPKNDDSGAFPIIQLINSLMANAIKREQEMTFEEVPYWENKYVYSVDELETASNQQKKFYNLFKSQFLEGHYLDISGNWNYAFVLMFDLADAYIEHMDYELLNNQLYTLAEKYPIVENQIDTTIREVVLAVKQKEADKKLKSHNESKGQRCRWITSGEIIYVQGIKLTRGNFYIGECFLLPKPIIKANYEYMWGGKSPYIYGSVLNPNLPVSKLGNQHNVFCSYNDMTPCWRHEYLLWLSNQNTISETSTDIIQFYLYGCEIRMFIDPETEMSEREKMILDIIGLYELIALDAGRKDRHELQYILSEFIVCSITKFFPTKLEDKHIRDLFKDNTTFQRHYIAQRIPNKGNLSATDAFEIAKSLYDIEQIVPVEYLSVAEDYFVELFSKEYRIPYFNNEINDKETKTICYYNNNGRFNPDRVYLYYEMKLIPNDVWNIRQTIISCYWEIHSKFRSYNKLKSRTDSETIAAILLLPDEIDVLEKPQIQALVTCIENEMSSNIYMAKSMTWMLKHWEYDRQNNKSIHIEYADSIIEGLRRIGFGIVPNYKIEEKRFAFSDICVIYRNPNQLLVEISPGYQQAELFIKLAAQIVSDKVCDDDFVFVDQHLKTFGLTDGNLLHLSAFARWMFMSRKKRLDKHTLDVINILPLEERASIGKALIGLSCSNGNFHPKRIESLKKNLALLGLESDNIHTQIHHMLTDVDDFAVVEKKTDAIEYIISNNLQPAHQQKFFIDNDKLGKLERQTQEAQELLSNIFVEEKEEPKNIASNEADVAWRSLLELLLTKDVWKRLEVERICEEKQLMLGAVLEQINDYSYEIVADAVVEDDGEDIYVSLEYKNELL